MDLYEEKVILMFKSFPKDKEEYILLFEDLRSIQQEGVMFYYWDNYSRYIDIFVGGVGIFRKRLNLDNEYNFVFCIDNSNKCLSVEKVSMGKADELCERFIPFMLSHGHDRRKIPLLINDFHEFAKFALEYTP